MHNTRKINDDVFWVGSNDKRLALFENAFPIPSGVSYNSYLVLDEKNILLDCVDKSAGKVFFENLHYLLQDKKLDFVVINHVEPDHCATLDELVLRYPDVKIIGNARTISTIKQFFDFDYGKQTIVVKEGDEICSGKHKFVFYMTAMVHWPEVMVTYDAVDKYLYSADAFGTFGTINGNIFADETDFERDFLDEARRYYTNIAGKYGMQVQAALKKATTLEISTILPLHGPIWRKNLGWFIDKYQKWSSYTPEEEGVLIAYASVYGNTENAANILATKLAEFGIKKIAVFDVSVSHPSFVLSQAFRFSHIVFASTTYNSGIFVNMETLLRDIAAHNLQNRTIAFIENGTWAAQSEKQMKEILLPLKNINYLENSVSLKSSVKKNNLAEIENLAKNIVNSFSAQKSAKDRILHENKIEPNSFFKLTYGLFVLTSSQNGKDGGCIINTVMQITDSPKKRIAVAVNKTNFTHDLIVSSGIFNVSALTTDSNFDIFKRFGFQSGRDVNKFAEFEEFCEKSENNLYYLKQNTNAFFSAKVVSENDFETHSLFIAEITEASVLSNVDSLSYRYYFENIKPKPAAKPQNSSKKTYVCKICGYIHETDDDLPDDFICPLCKHGKNDMELQ
ncbi:MAG: flavin reductase [Chitinispirillales bacterium]|jgi:flavorubredoxin/flavin reductase (DIM6/NTAB) family NADH-FMN oxidoreductase RutF|nr:flavin reductase [Chitinispirillales bacterium]